jgi:hypothetical protein
MKSKLFLSLISVICLQQSGYAQQLRFEGEVEYSIVLKGPMMDFLKNTLPTRQVVKFKNGKGIMKMEGGAKPIEVFFDGRQNFVIQREPKNYKKMPNPDLLPEVVKLEHTEIILGYRCQPYEVTITQKDQKVKQMVWACAELPKGVNENPAFWHYDAVKGLPLKVTVIAQLGFGVEVEMTFVATALHVGNQSETEVALPVGFVLVE